MKKIIIASTVATLSAAVLIGGTVFAATNQTSASSDPNSSLISAVATKFNLKESDVKAVFDEQRAKQQQARENKVKEEISQLVSNKKLTQEQANKIIAKRAELAKERQANKADKSNTTQTDHEAKKSELKKWLSDNGIDSNYVYLLTGRGVQGSKKSSSSASNVTSTNTGSTSTKSSN